MTTSSGRTLGQSGSTPTPSNALAATIRPDGAPKGASDFLLETSREYAIYVCDLRGIPLIADGLKHGQRIALWLLRNRAEKIKTYALSGLMGFEKLYVHGETSANDAVGKLAAPFKNNHCLITGHGQFGSRIAPVDGIGAPRYTEVSRSKIAEALLYRDLDLVPLEDNYDGSNKQPRHFLPLIPTVLLNGVVGVAVGWSTEILPRSLRALIDATEAALTGADLPPIPPHYERYKATVRATGQGNQWEMSGRVEITDTSTLRITELPPAMPIEAFRKTLIGMEETGVINTFTDRSTDCINITVRMRRGSLKGWTEAKALDFFKLRVKTTERIVVIDWNGHSIRQFESAEALVREFAAWRLGWYQRRFEKLKADALDELAYWKALAILFRRGFAKQLGGFADRARLEAAVTTCLAVEQHTFGQTHLDRVTALPTYRWTESFRSEVEAIVSRLEAEIHDHGTTLSSKDSLKAVYLEELVALRKLR